MGESAFDGTRRQVFGKLKGKYSGSGLNSWSKWIQEMDIEVIREEAFTISKTYFQ